MPDEIEEGPKIGNLSEVELAEAIRAPGIWVNKSVITGVGPIAKLVFLETRSESKNEYAHARAAVLMNLNDLLQLRDLINGLEEKMRTVEIKPEGASEQIGAPDSSDG